MDTPTTPEPLSERELILRRTVNVPAKNLYAGWTQPELLKQWFAPKPWTTPHAELDVRPGGSCLVTMRSPEGQDFPNPGVYLEVIPNKKLVITDAYVKAWEPSAQPFITIILTFDDLGGGKTEYTACVRHWSVADRKKHEEMGFYPGWNQCMDQLVVLMSQS
jgi:uncharacterized protein YndB with AHSA1/START domain